MTGRAGQLNLFLIMKYSPGGAQAVPLLFARRFDEFFADYSVIIGLVESLLK